MVPTPSSILRNFVQILFASTIQTWPITVSSAAVPECIDVAIVGAGLSGLSTAKNLISGGKSVVVLEARNRVGGKVFNKQLKNGGVTEVGAEFVGPTQDRVLAYISELGLKTYPTYSKGNSGLWRNNTRTVYLSDPAFGGLPPVSDYGLTQTAEGVGQIEAWAASLNVSAPWSHPQAKEWDSISVEQWMQKQGFGSDATLLFTLFTKSVLSVEPREVSLLYTIAYVASAGNETNPGTISRLITVEGGGQESRVVGGTGLIPQRLADKVGKERIKFNAQVTSIKKQNDGTYVVVSKAGTIKAKRVVLALAPPLIETIAFSPPLPAARQQLNKLMKMGAIGKGVAIYQTPFWRADEDLNAQFLSDIGPTRSTYDNTPETPSYGALMGFILGDDMRALDSKPDAAVQAAVTSQYVQFFGAKARNTTEFVVQRWDLEEFSKGGPVAVAPPNVLVRYGEALRKKFGGIHFAGTETSVYWTGYMDGAIRSGERVAKEILDG
jgi:monoamine oxidase